LYKSVLRVFVASWLLRFKEIESRVNATIDDAVEFAANAPDPDPAEAAGDLYA